jgi:hypothetical protein
VPNLRTASATKAILTYYLCRELSNYRKAQPYINLYTRKEQGDSMTKSHFSVNPKMKDWSKAERDAYILHGKEPEHKRTLS